MSLKYEVYYNKKHGIVSYLRHDLKHRVNSPSSIWTDGDMFWCEYGRFHRVGGYAIISNMYTSYYIRGKIYTEIEYEFKIRNH